MDLQLTAGHGEVADQRHGEIQIEVNCTIAYRGDSRFRNREVGEQDACAERELVTENIATEAGDVDAHAAVVHGTVGIVAHRKISIDSVTRRQCTIAGEGS